MKKASCTVNCQQFNLSLAHRRPKSCLEKTCVVKNPEKAPNELGMCTMCDQILIMDYGKDLRNLCLAIIRGKLVYSMVM